MNQIKNKKNLIPTELIRNKILLIRGQKVMLDSDLALLYGVETKRLNEQVKRNNDRFPSDFCFRLTENEFESLRSHFATTNEKNSENSQPLRSQNVTLKRGGKRYNPYVFTEHGVAMLSGVLKSKKAIDVNIAIIRTFIKLRDFALSYKVLADKLSELEHGSKRHDKKITEIFVALRLLAQNSEDEKPKRDIGFRG